MSAERFEAFLARLYVDAAARERFRAEPLAEVRRCGLSDEECRSLRDIDWTGLEMAARSFAAKRARKHGKQRPRMMRWLRDAWRTLRAKMWTT